MEATVSAGGGSVIIRVEREFAVELVAETKVCVKVCTDGCGDYEDRTMTMAARMETMMISIQTCWMMSCKPLIRKECCVLNLRYHMHHKVR